MTSLITKSEESLAAQSSSTSVSTSLIASVATATVVVVAIIVVVVVVIVIRRRRNRQQLPTNSVTSPTTTNQNARTNADRNLVTSSTSRKHTLAPGSLGSEAAVGSSKDRKKQSIALADADAKLQRELHRLRRQETRLTKKQNN